MATVFIGERMRFTPAARARSTSELRSDWQARWTDTSEEEHAVSTDMLGPSSPKTCETRRAVQPQAGRGEGLDAVHAADLQEGVVEEADAHVDAGADPGQVQRRQGGV